MENPPSPGKRERKMTFQIVSEKDTVKTKGNYFKINQYVYLGIHTYYVDIMAFTEFLSKRNESKIPHFPQFV